MGPTATSSSVFLNNLDEAFGAKNAAEALDVACFAGRNGSPAGFTDEGLMKWVGVEAHYTGRSVALSEGGRPIFGYQPDATLRAPVPGRAVRRLADAAADVADAADRVG